jgi:hypothetical protein
MRCFRRRQKRIKFCGQTTWLFWVGNDRENNIFVALDFEVEAPALRYSCPATHPELRCISSRAGRDGEIGHLQFNCLTVQLRLKTCARTGIIEADGSTTCCTKCAIGAPFEIRLVWRGS